MRQIVQLIASMFRALIMLAILGGGAYLALEHTPVLEIAREKFSEWQNRQSEHDWGGGSAPAFATSGDATPGQSAAGGTPNWPPVSPKATTSSQPTPQPQAATKQYPEQYAGFESSVESSVTPPIAESEYSTLERRLRQMGVNYSMLESDGNDGGRFRFLCRVALPGGSTKYQKFEAVGSQPIDAMRQVVAKVERWRSYDEPSQR